MVGLKMRDINRDVIILFVICYEYSMSFTNVLKLFQISKKYFWTFMEICSPMLKMGVRKAASIRKTADKILGCFENSKSVADLNPKEERIFESLTWFVEDSFSDGDSCLHVSQFSQFPFVTGHAPSNLVVAKNFNEILKNIDRISYVEMAGVKYYKTSRFLYFMEKYSGETDLKELNSLSVIEMMKRISDGEDKIREKEAEFVARK